MHALLAVLLTVAPIAGAAARFLITRLAESSDNAREQTLHKVILSQFRWCGLLVFYANPTCAIIRQVTVPALTGCDVQAG